jgi:hypothetical protein
MCIVFLFSEVRAAHSVAYSLHYCKALAPARALCVGRGAWRLTVWWTTSAAIASASSGLNSTRRLVRCLITNHITEGLCCVHEVTLLMPAPAGTPAPLDVAWAITEDKEVFTRSPLAPRGGLWTRYPDIKLLHVRACAAATVLRWWSRQGG